MIYTRETLVDCAIAKLTVEHSACIVDIDGKRRVVLTETETECWHHPVSNVGDTNTVKDQTHGCTNDTDHHSRQSHLGLSNAAILPSEVICHPVGHLSLIHI